MTQTLQEALLKAGLVSKDKLKKAEEEKKRALHEARREAREAARPAQEAFRGKRAPRPPRPETRQPPPKKSVGFIEGKHHHHMRTECEDCSRTTPDVEYYEHKNKSLDKYWLCVTCADKNNILDEFRQTMQSQHAKNGMFRRGYGPTKIFK